MDRRKFSRTILSHLPGPIRLELIRRTVEVDQTWPDPLVIKLATEASEFEGAFRLLHDCYVKEGYMDPHPSGMRALPQHLLPQTATIVAKWNGETIGTVSLIRDNPIGLPMEKIFDLSERRKGGRRLTEVSSLALNPAFRGKLDLVLFPMFRFLYHYARYYFGADELVIAVNPKMVDLYRAFITFEPLSSKPKTYDFVKGVPAVGLFLDFRAIDRRLASIFGSRQKAANLMEYFQRIPCHPGNQLPRRAYQRAFDPVLSTSLINELLLDKAALAASLSRQECSAILRAYGNEAIADKIRERLPAGPELASARRDTRFDTRMPAIVRGPDLRVEVLNVSSGGLLLRGPESLPVGQQLDLSVQLSERLQTGVQAKVCWSRDHLHGLEIQVPSLDWFRMIQSFRDEFDALASPAPALKSAA